MQQRKASFRDDFLFSLGHRKDSDLETIRAFFGESCTSVEKTDEAEDRAGNDYRVTLRRGATVLIDAKARRKGARRWWRDEPELALERWSVMPCDRCPAGKTGWALDEAKNTDLILFTFDASDTEQAILLPFQHLRMAFRKYLPWWWKVFKHERQQNDGWASEAVFVPASVVTNGIITVSHGQAITVAGQQIVLPGFVG